MITSLTITDLTRMNGNRVCIAGVTEEGLSIRPKFARRIITEDWLYDHDEAVIRPFARLQLDLLQCQPDPPHTEDWIIRENYRVHEQLLEPPERLILLESILDPDVASIFGAEIQTNPGFYIREHEGLRSLGTVRARQINFVRHFQRQGGGWEYRIEFTDLAGCGYNLAVTDLAFRYLIDHMREGQKMSTRQIGWHLFQKLREGDVYLRIGLTRPTWQKHPHCCFLQINGVYTFPDYLDGRCFADFLQTREINSD